MNVEPIAIDWRPSLPVFAKESFLRAVGDEYGWLGGFSAAGQLRCLLPYTIVRKPLFRMVRFRLETIPSAPGFEAGEEKDFLNGVLRYFRSAGADMIIPGSSNAIFRTYPDGADAAPYGTYVVDLTPPEEEVWKNIDRIMRQNIKSAAKTGVTIRDAGPDEIKDAHALIRETFGRSRLPFMDLRSFSGFVSGLGENGKLLAAEKSGAAQSYCLFGFSEYRAYAIYAGNLPAQAPGANKLLYWEAMRLFKGLGVKTFDFFGTRVDPEKGSKQEAIALLKRRFGSTLERGFIWKCPIHPLKYRLYGLAARLRSGGDIVDAERHKMDVPAAKDD